jgi:hypothetical protein
MTCSLCTKEASVKGLCRPHYLKAHRGANKEKYKAYKLKAKKPKKEKIILSTKGNSEWQKLSLEDYQWRLQHQ